MPNNNEATSLEINEARQVEQLTRQLMSGSKASPSSSKVETTQAVALGTLAALQVFSSRS